MPQPSQTLLFHIAGPMDGEIAEVNLVWSRLGEDREVRLSDDGLIHGDIPWDGVWTGIDVGPPVREVQARIFITDLEGNPHQAYWGTVPVSDARSEVLAWQLMDTQDPQQPWKIQTVTAAWPGAAILIPEATTIYIGAAWTGLCFAVVASLVHVARRAGVGW